MPGGIMQVQFSDSGNGRKKNCNLSGSCVLVPRIYEGDAPKGQGESEYTENGAFNAVYSPPASLRIGHPPHK